jgi:SAM-dependent methyltransferase
MVYFDRSVNSYATRYYSARWLAYRRFVASLVQPHLEAASLVLDLGCGPLPSFPGLYPVDGNFIYVDLSSGQLRYLRQQHPGSRVVRADAESLCFRAASFDAVVLFGILHHLPDPMAAMDGVLRILRPGGIVVGHEPSDYWNPWKESPNERGFSLEEIQQLYGRLADVTIRTVDHLLVESLAHITWRFLAAPLHTLITRGKANGNRAASLFWSKVFRVQSILDRIGVRGKDFVITARKADS